MRSSLLLFLATCLTASSAFGQQPEAPPARIDGYHEFNYGQVSSGVEQWTQAIRVSEPGLRSEVRGDVPVKFQAPGMTRATAFCWSQGEPANRWGEDVNLTPEGIALNAEGNGSFVFPADNFPHGPVNVRIYAHNEKDRKDIFELQLFNTGGLAWNQGIPKRDPPAAKGLRLVYADDFDGPLSISNDGRGTTYMAHKPGGGDFSGWPFSNVLGDGKPFGQKQTWLRIAARKDEESPKGRTGLLASVNRNFQGIWAKAPCYLECRFTAQSAIGTWPAFWTLAFGDQGTDELDIIEAYGGKGKGNPNHPGYSIVSHFWRQKNPDGTDKKSAHTRVEMMQLGGKSYWSTTFHTYAVYVGLDDTVYYFDDIEVLRHPTNVVSRENPHFFMINYAIGGISRWPIDLERYGNGSDMWVDYVRVYAKEPVDPDYRPDLGPKPKLTTAGGRSSVLLCNKRCPKAPATAHRFEPSNFEFPAGWHVPELAKGVVVDLSEHSASQEMKQSLDGRRAEWDAHRLPLHGIEVHSIDYECSVLLVDRLDDEQNGHGCPGEPSDRLQGNPRAAVMGFDLLQFALGGLGEHFEL